MPLETFQMERMQSQWEHVVQYNLSESGVAPVRLSELLNMTGDGENLQTQFMNRRLAYSQTNGTVELRTNISKIYGTNVTAENVIVTNGTAEANFLAIWNLLDQRNGKDELVLQLPNFMQIWGISRAFGAQVKPFHLKKESNKWIFDLDELQNVVTPKTRCIVLCNPNNPTGATLGVDELKAIADLAAEYDTWILSDEVYRGAELEEMPKTTPTMFDYSDKVLITSGLSKAYGLPGLRIGWIVSPDEDQIADFWRYKDYTTTQPGSLSDFLAQIALQPEIRVQLLKRTRNILQTNWTVLHNWFQEHGDLFEVIPPKAGAITMVKYNLDIGSTELVYRLKDEKSVLIVPGDHFGIDHHLRIGYGDKTDYLISGLTLVHEFLEEIKKEAQ
ncbi:MAG: aminotransferase class I/II-fold pyridoxal phosphate-dependent enzyme [Candidatus Hodarchaeales archaeon]|jgi:aspartate/methionine/tyrosine aminotransferase